MRINLFYSLYQKPLIGLSITIIVVIILLFWWIYLPNSEPSLVEEEATEQLLAGKVYKNPKEINPFQLIDQSGKIFDLNRLKNKWSFLFFGYTYCPDVCPMTLLTYKEMHQQLLETLGTLSDVQFVFVSVDPERDTTEMLEQYVTYFHPDFIGVTGSQTAIRDFTKPLGIFYRAVERPGNDVYLVEHSGSILLTDPQARLLAVFPAPHHPTDLVATYRQIREQWQEGSSP